MKSLDGTSMNFLHPQMRNSVHGRFITQSFCAILKTSFHDIAQHIFINNMYSNILSNKHKLHLHVKFSKAHRHSIQNHKHKNIQEVSKFCFVSSYAHDT